MPDREDESKFLAKLKQRDEAAFTELVRRHQHSIFNLVLRLLGNREEAEDAAQEVFVSVFRHIDQFREEARLSTWLYRVASNHCINRLKYLKRRRSDRVCQLEEVPEAQLGSPHAPPASQRPDQLLEGVQTEETIQQAIADLEEEQRMVLVLRDIEGLSYQEISQITELPIGTVKSRLHRARLAIKERIADDG